MDSFPFSRVFWIAVAANIVGSLLVIGLLRALRASTRDAV